MIIDEHELIEMFTEGDDVGYDYLIKNAEDSEQIRILQSLKELYRTVSGNYDNKAILDAYEEARNILLKEKIGLSIYLIIEISDLTNIAI